MDHLQDVVAARKAGRDGTARATRKNADLTLRELAAHLQIHSSSLSEYERGRARPGPEIAARWMEALRLMTEGADLATARAERLRSGGHPTRPSPG